MFSHPFQKKAYEAAAAALPFAVDPGKITMEPGASYLPSPIKLRDYAAGVPLDWPTRNRYGLTINIFN